MIMPGKHVDISESLIGLGGLVLSLIDTPKTLDEIWEDFNGKYIKTKKVNKKYTIDKFILSLDLLYILGAVDISEGGEVYNVSQKTRRQ